MGVNLALHRKRMRGVWPPRGKYIFGVGFDLVSSITVEAKNFEEAYAKAYAGLNTRYEKAGKEPPVGWTIALLNMVTVQR